jgi:transposase
MPNSDHEEIPEGPCSGRSHRMPGSRRQANRTTRGPSRYFIPGTNQGVSLPPDSDLKWEISLRKEGHYGKVRKFTPEYRDEAVKMVIEGPRPIAEVARDLGINESTLGNWVTKYRDEHPASEDLNISDRARLKELEKENRELRMERDFLKKAAAFFAKEQ